MLSVAVVAVQNLLISGCSTFFVVSIIMLVSGYNNIILLPNCTMLYYVFSGPLSLRAYVPEIITLRTSRSPASRVAG